MSVEKFLDELKFLLSDLPEEEREEALDFYRCYFEDAGVENEADVIAELGSPEKLAYSIREGLKNKEDEGEYTETGYRTYEDISAPATRYAHREGADKTASDKTDSTSGYNHISAEERYKQRYAKPGKKEAKQAKREEKQAKKDSSQGKTQQYSYQDAQGSKKEPEKKGHGALTPLYIIGQILLVILKVLMVIAAICIVILLICVLIALVAAVCAAIGASIGFLVVGIGLLVTGAGLVGVAMIGIAFIAFAIFLLLLAALVAFCKKGLAGGIRGITNVAGNVVHGKKKKEA